MLIHAVRSELIKLRAYRLTYFLLPLVLVCLVVSAIFGFDAVRGSAAEGTESSTLIESAAFAFGLGSWLSGVWLGVFAALMVTIDLGSGTLNQSLLVLPRRTVLLAKVVVAGAVAVLASLVGALAIAAAAIVMLPAGLPGVLVSAPALWTTLAGTLASHLTWTSLGLGMGLLMRRQAAAMGAALVIMLGLPLAGASFAFAGHTQHWLQYLPAGLMQAATAAPSSQPALAPLAASTALLLWCGVFVGSGWLRLRR